MTAIQAPPAYDWRSLPEAAGPQSESSTMTVSYDAQGRVMLPGGARLGYCPPLMDPEDRDREIAQLRAQAGERAAITKAAREAADAAIAAFHQGRAERPMDDYRAPAPDQQAGTSDPAAQAEPASAQAEPPVDDQPLPRRKSAASTSTRKTGSK